MSSTPKLKIRNKRFVYSYLCDKIFVRIEIDPVERMLICDKLNTDIFYQFESINLVNDKYN
jgi:hypothetical protein